MAEVSSGFVGRVRAAWLGLPMRWAFALCWVLALYAVWVPHYPAGIDLPQHANIFRLWNDLRSGPYEYRAMYYLDPFTPYLLPYAIAFPLTKLAGSLFAIKCLLTFAAVATPLYLVRWLRVVGGDPGFGLLGFVIAFDYCYIWGFISCALAIPLMFAYLAEFEAQGDNPSDKRMVLAALLAVALFFSHGITFGVAMIISGLSWVLRGRWIERMRAAFHVVPVGIIATLWLIVRKRESSAPASEWFDWKRGMHLFSGCFTPYAHKQWALVAAGGVVLFLLIARPKLEFRLARVVPLAVSIVGFIALPNWLASTWLVATRFCVFVHAFSPGVLRPRDSDPIARQWRWALLALVVAFLCLLNVRLHTFNQELEGFREVAALIPPGADVQTRVPETNGNSVAFDDAELGQVPAWVTAEHGGLIANDSAVSGYFQIPIRHKNVFLQDYPYVIAHGRLSRYRNALRGLTHSPQGSAELIKQSGDWLLYKRKAIETADYLVGRHGQGSGDLHFGREIDGKPLTLAGVTYPNGLGTHARSFIRIHLKRAAARFKGACGMDDTAGNRGKGAFRVRDSNGKVLFESGPLHAGVAPTPFSVAVSGQQELILEVDEVDRDISFAHADWLNLALD